MRFIIILIVTLIVPARVYAIGGVGDVTYDPAVHGELVSMFEQAKEMYKTAKEQLDTIVKVESTIQDAYRAYESLKNFDLHEYFETLRLRKFNSAAGLRAELSRMEGRVGGGVNFVDYQLDQLASLENLMLLQDAAAKNVKDSSIGNLNANSSAQITAQSVSALTALAAAQEQRRIEDASNAATQEQFTRDAFYQSGDIYFSIGE